MATAAGDPTHPDAALRDGCALLDRSERGRLALTGAGAAAFLNGQVTNDVEALTPGTGCYAALLTPKGKMLADLRILDTGDELLLDTERPALQGLFDQLRRTTIGHDAQLHKRTLQTAQISLLGPRAAQVADAGDLPAAEHAHVASSVDGHPVRLVRTAAGVDVLCEATDGEAVLRTLGERGATTVPEAAADVLRVEAGIPRYGVDLDDSVIPQEAGLNERAVSFTKGCYTGQETVARLFYRGRPNRSLRGLRLDAPVPSGTVLRLGDREVGTLTSVAASPRYGDIGLALVRREAAPGTVLQAGDDVRATVVDLPFA